MNQRLEIIISVLKGASHASGGKGGHFRALRIDWRGAGSGRKAVLVMAKQCSRKWVMGMRGLIDIRYTEGNSRWWGGVLGMSVNLL
jgi:hypothetical protein